MSRISLPMLHRRTFLVAMAGMIGDVLLAPSGSTDEAYPNRSIRLIVPYPPGGANDSMARTVGQQLNASLKQPVIVDNRGGAGGAIGTSAAAKSPSDGYTLLIINTLPHTAAGTLYRKSPFDPIGDFSPISMVSSAPYVLVVNKQSSFKTFQEFVAYARAHPGKLNYASGGQGGATHLVMELLMRDSGIHMSHVPYRGGGPALTDLLIGQVDVTFENVVALLPMIQAGDFRALALSSAKAAELLPGVPTIASELGREFDVAGRFAIVAPAGTPRPIIDRLNTAIVDAISAPDLQSTWRKMGIEPTSSTPDELATILHSEQELWSQVIGAADIKLD